MITLKTDLLEKISDSVFIRPRGFAKYLENCSNGNGCCRLLLMARLKDSEHDVTGYELNPKERHDSICAWGTIKPILTEYCKKTGRDFNDFLIHDGKNMHVKMNNDVKFDIGLHGLCTYDKLGLIKDFIKDSKVIYGKPPSFSYQLKKNMI